MKHRGRPAFLQSGTDERGAWTAHDEEFEVAGRAGARRDPGPARRRWTTSSCWSRTSRRPATARPARPVRGHPADRAGLLVRRARCRTGSRSSAARSCAMCDTPRRSSRRSRSPSCTRSPTTSASTTTGCTTSATADLAAATSPSYSRRYDGRREEVASSSSGVGIPTRAPCTASQPSARSSAELVERSRRPRRRWSARSPGTRPRPP